MQQFFAANYEGPAFQLFGIAHLAALGALLLINILLLRFRGAPEQQRARIRWAMAIILWLNEIGWHVWNYATGRWTIQSMLPLHLCSMLVWIGAIMLVTRNYRIYEFAYLLGISGALQALLTPDLGIYGFPHFRYFQTFISHGLIITSAIYMTAVEGFRPTLRSLGRAALWMNIYMVVVYFINSSIGSNYLMINGKPNTPSILDFMPAWPVYILYMEALGAIMMLLLYFPFALRDWRTARERRTSTSPADSD
jgi:hypothetical integral membrane protein (TIGR02206 family)